MSGRKWPVPGTRPVDRAREIARTLYAALLRVDPDAAEAIEHAAALAGELWLPPQPATYSLDDVVTVPQAAELAGVAASTVYTWVAADRPTRVVDSRDGLIHVRVRDLLEYFAHRAREDR